MKDFTLAASRRQQEQKSRAHKDILFVLDLFQQPFQLFVADRSLASLLAVSIRRRDVCRIRLIRGKEPALLGVVEDRVDKGQSSVRRVGLRLTDLAVLIVAGYFAGAISLATDERWCQCWDIPPLKPSLCPVG